MESRTPSRRESAFVDVDPAVSARMRRIRKVDTKPEIMVRRLAHGMGYRFRLHRRDLLGTPDLVFRNRPGTAALRLHAASR